MATSTTAERVSIRARALRQPEREPVRAELPTVGGDASTAVIRLYDVIDSWGGWSGLSSREMASVLDGLPASVTEIRLLINSPGGEVFEGVAILNQLRAHPAKVVAVVEGVAASAASFIAVGVDECVMAPNSELFIHDAWGVCVGNAQDMRMMAEDLDRFSDNIASIYQAKAGGTLEDWRAEMARERWYSAADAVEAGLADRIDERASTDDAARNRWDRSIFASSGRPAAAGNQASATPPSPSPVTGQEGGSALSDLTAFRDRLGLADTVSDDDIVAALEPLPEPTEDAPPAPAQLPAGVVAIDAAQLEQLRNDAQAGRDARAEQMRQHREQVVAAAVNDGRIPPARREHWLNQLEVDPGSEQVLAGLQKGLIPVGEPLGSNGAVDLDADDAIYAELFGKEAVTNG
jgi:ATP-dependent Clp endopeptidase proteolytic subunit ClpP